MARAKTFGLFRQQSPSSGGVQPTWYSALDVPADVRGALGKRRFVKSTEETDERLALLKAERFWKGWKAEIADARLNRTDGLESALAAIDRWRASTVLTVQAGDTTNAAPFGLSYLFRSEGPRTKALAKLKGTASFTSPPFTANEFSGAERYFEAHPDASREAHTPADIALALNRLAAVADDASAWRHVAGFDAELDRAVAAGGGTPMNAAVREKVRTAFGKAWLEVEVNREAARLRAAKLLAAVEAKAITAAGLASSPPQPQPPPYVPRPGDLTILEAIDAYTAFRASDTTPENFNRQYGHIFKLLKECFDGSRPFRTLSRADGEELAAVLRRIPSNAGKLYPGCPLKETVGLAEAEMKANAEAAAKALAEGKEFKPRRRVELMAVNTRRTYLQNLHAVCGWAIDRGAADINPMKGLIPPAKPSVKRRGYKIQELETLYATLNEERRTDAAMFWLPAICQFQGTRLSEIAQLLTSDVKREFGVDYFDLTPFDEDGVRDEAKHLKTRLSERAIPIHPALIEAGFLDFVTARRKAGGDRLFPDITPDKTGSWSTAFSKNYGRHLDRIGLTSPALTFHGLRHGWRDAARRAKLPDEERNALGGWAIPGVGSGYGDIVGVDQLESNLEWMAKIDFWGFKLPVPVAEAA